MKMKYKTRKTIWERTVIQRKYYKKEIHNKGNIRKNYKKWKQWERIGKQGKKYKIE